MGKPNTRVNADKPVKKGHFLQNLYLFPRELNDSVSGLNMKLFREYEFWSTQLCFSLVDQLHRHELSSQ